MHVARAALAAFVTLSASSCAWPVLGERAAGATRADELPVVLVPGFGGYRQMGAAGNYFGEVPRALRARGVDVHQPTLPPFSSSHERAEHLGRAIDAVIARTGARRVHLVAHSQGGVDARVALATLGYDDRVATLTTVSTPHRGAVVADLAQELPAPLLVALFDVLGGQAQAEAPVDLGDPDVLAALDSLSTPSMERFAEDHPDAPGVPIFSVAGVTGRVDGDVCDGGAWDAPDVVDPPNPLLVPSWAMLREQAGANDGAITTASARWGTFLGCVPADHLDEMDRGFDRARRIEPFRAVAFYTALVDALRAYEAGDDVDAVLRRAPRLREAAFDDDA